MKFRAAISRPREWRATTHTQKPEDRELVQLTERSNVGSILLAAVERRSTGGRGS